MFCLEQHQFGLKKEVIFFTEGFHLHWSHSTIEITQHECYECNFSLQMSRLIAFDSSISSFFLLFFLSLSFVLLSSDDLASFIHVSIRIFPETHTNAGYIILVFMQVYVYSVLLYLLERRIHVVLHLNPETLWAWTQNWSCLLWTSC